MTRATTEPGLRVRDLAGCNRGTCAVDTARPAAFEYQPMQVLAALADPTRRRIVELLANGEMAAGEVAGHFILSRAAVSQHLQHLLDAGLVHVRTVGQRRMYSFNVTGLNELESWLRRCRSIAIASAGRLPGHAG